MSSFVNEAEEAAAAWDARLRGAKASFRDRRAFHAWLQEDPGHQAAHDRLQLALATLRTHGDLPELSALRDEARNRVHASGRRRIAAVAACALAFLLLTLVVIVQPDGGIAPDAQPQGNSSYATAPGERARVTLVDGSVVTLDADTRIAVRIGSGRRDIALLGGRALFEVAKDPQRPFVVKAGRRTITALGTVFDVQLSPEALRVTLAEGSVAVRNASSRRRAAGQRILVPNEQLVLPAGAAEAELRVVDTGRALDWADARVFFEDEPLADAAAKMNRHSERKILIDPAVADLRINGMFRRSNQAGFLEALQATLPVRIREEDEAILVTPRSDEALHRADAHL